MSQRRLRAQHGYLKNLLNKGPVFILPALPADALVLDTAPL
jgi:hypothetical protein